MNKIRSLIATCIITLSTTFAVTPAFSSEPQNSPLQGEIDSILAEFGGEQTAWNEVSWDDGNVVLTLDTGAVHQIAPFAIGGCDSGKYCAYSATLYSGRKLSFSTCPSTHTSFSALGGPVRSVANSRSSGTVRVYGGSTLKATLSPNSGASNVSGVTKITCS